VEAIHRERLKPCGLELGVSAQAHIFREAGQTDQIREWEERVTAQVEERAAAERERLMQENERLRRENELLRSGPGRVAFT
jgi:hypothetical protein